MRFAVGVNMMHHAPAGPRRISRFRDRASARHLEELAAVAAAGGAR
jgi:hypothetical protein